MTKWFRRTSRPSGGVGLLEDPQDYDTPTGGSLRRGDEDVYPEMVGRYDTGRPYDTPRDLGSTPRWVALCTVDTVTLPAVDDEEALPVSGAAGALLDGLEGVPDPLVDLAPRALLDSVSGPGYDSPPDSRVDAWLPTLERWPALRGRVNGTKRSGYSGSTGSLTTASLSAPTISPPDALPAGLLGGLPFGGAMPADGVTLADPAEMVRDVPSVYADSDQYLAIADRFEQSESFDLPEDAERYEHADRFERTHRFDEIEQFDETERFDEIDRVDETDTAQLPPGDGLLIFEELRRDAASRGCPSLTEHAWRSLLNAPLEALAPGRAHERAERPTAGPSLTAEPPPDSGTEVEWCNGRTRALPTIGTVPAPAPAPRCGSAVGDPPMVSTTLPNATNGARMHGHRPMLHR